MFYGLLSWKRWMVFGTLNKEQQAIADSSFDLGCRLFEKEDIGRWRDEHGLPANVSLEIAQFLREKTKIFDPDVPAGQYFEAMLIVEQLARAAGAALPLSTDLMGILSLKELNVKRHVNEYCRYYIDNGRFPFAFSSTEPGSGSDTKSLETVVKRVDGIPYLNGRKVFTNNGEFCPYLLISAIDSDAIERGVSLPTSLWLVENGSPGIKAMPIKKRGQGILPFADMTFNNVKLEERDNLMKASNVSSSKLSRIYNIDRLFGCAACLGMAQAAMDDAALRAVDRKSLGRAIGSFQLIEEMILQMQVKIENMRNLAYSAASTLDGKGSSRIEVAMAKWYIPRTSVEVASDAIQIFGAAGYTSSERVYGIWEDCRGYQIASGTDQVMVSIAAPRILAAYEARIQ